MSYTHVSDEYFVRDFVQEELENKVLDIANTILDRGIVWYGEDDESAEQVAECVMEFLKLDDMTEDEFCHVFSHIHFYAGLGYLYRMGKISDEDCENLKLPEILKVVRN